MKKVPNEWPWVLYPRNPILKASFQSVFEARKTKWICRNLLQRHNLNFSASDVTPISHGSSFCHREICWWYIFWRLVGAYWRWPGINFHLDFVTIHHFLTAKERKEKSISSLDHFILRQVLSPPHHCWIKIKQSQR